MRHGQARHFSRRDRRRAQTRRGADGDRARVDRAVGRGRFGKIRRVANRHAGIRAGKHELKGILEKAAAHARVHRRRHRCEGSARRIHRAGRRRREVAHHAAGVQAVAVVGALRGIFGLIDRMVVGRELRHDRRRGFRREKAEVAAAFVQLEIRVQPGRGERVRVVHAGRDLRGLAVFPGGIQHEVLPRIQQLHRLTFNFSNELSLLPHVVPPRERIMPLLRCPSNPG